MYESFFAHMFGKMITGRLHTYRSINTFHQRKCFIFVIICNQ